MRLPHTALVVWNHILMHLVLSAALFCSASLHRWASMPLNKRQGLASGLHAQSFQKIQHEGMACVGLLLDVIGSLCHLLGMLDA